MAYEIPLLIDSKRSTGDMSSYQYRAVALSTAAGYDDGVALVAARGAAVHGVWLDNSTASDHGRLMLEGVAKLAAGDSSGTETAISPGDIVVASSVGQAVASTAADLHAIGIAQEALSTGSTGWIAVHLTIGALTT